jgi:hypothetical protein
MSDMLRSVRLRRHLHAWLLLGVVLQAAASAQPPVRNVPAGTIVIDASEFVHLMPARNLLTDQRPYDPEADGWIFNNLAMVFRSSEPAVAHVDVPAAGRYHLFVRALAATGGSFGVTVGGRAAAGAFGGTRAEWKGGGVFDLPAGRLDVALIDATGSPVFDVLVLTGSPLLAEDELRAMQFPDEVELLKDYRIPPAHAVKFGDLTGDGRMDFVVLTRDYSARAYDHDGRELWAYTAPPEHARLRAEFEAPGVIWDFDGDGRAEVVHWRALDGREWIAMADGRTGEVIHRVEWPSKPMPHVYNNFRLAVARLEAGRPRHLVVLCDSGDAIAVAAYDASLRERWRVDKALRKDHLGHYVYPRDVTGNGIDEVFVSHVAFDADGHEIWNNLPVFPVHHDHADSYRFGDLDGDGRIDAMAAMSDIGMVVLDAQTGRIKWMRRANHAQQVEWGPFLAAVPGNQVAVNGRVYGDRAAGDPALRAVVHFFPADGGAPASRSPWPDRNPIVSAYRQAGPSMGALVQWPQHPINGNPDFVTGDWHGDGSTSLFWHRFHLDGHGMGTLFFAQEVYHMFDFVANGADEVIALDKSQGILQVYGRRGVEARPARRDDDYLRHSVANHTHY